MRIGFLSEYDPERIEFAKANGFTSVELATSYFKDPPDYVPPADGWKQKAQAVKAAYDEAGITISCIGAFYVNHMDPEISEKAGESVRNAILFAEETGVGVVAGFAGRLLGEPLEASIPRFKEIWGAHARFADDHGIRIAFECCPMGAYNTPSGGINCISTPDMYERCLDSVDSTALGLEWDPSHLVPLLVDPIVNIREFGDRIYHVHAKGARINWDIAARKGFWFPGAVEHCFPGFGDEDWGLIIKELRRAGYNGDLNIEGWHDAVFRDKRGMTPEDIPDPARGPKAPDLEDAGLIIAKNHLQQWCPPGF